MDHSPAVNEWIIEAERAMLRLCARKKDFSSDDLLARVGHPDKRHRGNGKNNLVGSLFHKFSQEKRMEVVGYTQSQQPHRKGGLIRVWRGI